MIAYYNGEFLPRENIFISPDDRGFLLADGLYEVIRSYSGKLFRMEDHIERLNYGARELRLNHTDFS
ncbi:MAG: D-alanine aminotransferase Dat, partial [Spirochaetales bacterium]